MEAIAAAVIAAAASIAVAVITTVQGRKTRNASHADAGETRAEIVRLSGQVDRLGEKVDRIDARLDGHIDIHSTPRRATHLRKVR